MALRVAAVALLACLVLLGFALATGSNTGETTVRVSATPVFPAIPWAQQRDDFEVLVRVEAPATVQTHAPIDLVAVLDVSESMNAGAAPHARGPSRLDLLKKAMKFVISKLGDRDRLAIVAFNDHVVERHSTDLLRLSGHGRCRAERVIDELEAGGRTALRPALERTVRILDERPMGKDGRVGFVLLVSDGIEDSCRTKWCNEGIGKYPVHTFGLSASHDPRALHAIAQASGGTYSFVNEKLDSITGAMAVCLGGLKTVVASRARIVLTAAEQGGVEIKSIDSGGFPKHVSGDRRWGEIVPGVLYAGEVKHFIVRLHVPARCAACGDYDHHQHRQQQQLLTVAVVSGKGIDTTPMENAVVLKVQRPQVVADAGQPAPSPSPAVVSHIVLSELVDLVATFARDEIGSSIAAVDIDLGGRLEHKWEEFAERHKFWSGVDDLMVGLDGDIRAMASSLRRSGSLSAAAYVYSWVSSYRTQRATAMGSPDKVLAQFVTSRMRQMLDEARDFQAEEPIGRHPETTAGGGEQEDSTLLDINMEMIDRRLQLWYKLKREVPILFRQPGETSEDAEWNHLTAITQQASIEAIDRAMHNDMYLAVVHASNRRACYSKRRGGSEPATGTGTAC